MSIFQAREWWSAETEAASVSESADDEEDADDDVVTTGGGEGSAAAGDDESDILKSVSVETASFASTMGNQVKSSLKSHTCTIGSSLIITFATYTLYHGKHKLHSRPM